MEVPSDLDFEEQRLKGLEEQNLTEAEIAMLTALPESGTHFWLQGPSGDRFQGPIRELATRCITFDVDPETSGIVTFRRFFDWQKEQARKEERALLDEDIVRVRELFESGSRVWIERKGGYSNLGKIHSMGEQGLAVTVSFKGPLKEDKFKTVTTKTFLEWQDKGGG